MWKSKMWTSQIKMTIIKINPKLIQNHKTSNQKQMKPTTPNSCTKKQHQSQFKKQAVMSSMSMILRPKSLIQRRNICSIGIHWQLIWYRIWLMSQKMRRKLMKHNFPQNQEKWKRSFRIIKMKWSMKKMRNIMKMRPRMKNKMRLKNRNSQRKKSNHKVLLLCSLWRSKMMRKLQKHRHQVVSTSSTTHQPNLMNNLRLQHPLLLWIKIQHRKRLRKKKKK